MARNAAQPRLATRSPQQASSLATAAAQLIAAQASAGLVGVVIAAGAIAAAFALYSKYKATASKQEVPTFEQGGQLVGGYVEGPRHSQQGILLRDRARAFYEIEGGEFVTNRKATRKHRHLLEAINSDRLNSINTDRLPDYFAGAIDRSSVHLRGLRDLAGKVTPPPVPSTDYRPAPLDRDSIAERLEQATAAAAERVAQTIENRPIFLTDPKTGKVTEYTLKPLKRSKKTVSR